jgi:hypothetical protein
MAKLDQQEERLVDLAADGTLPQARIRAKLTQLATDRTRIQEGLVHTTDELSVGAELLQSAIELCRDPAALYARATDGSRRAMNETFFEQFFFDDRGIVTQADLKPPFEEIKEAAQVFLSDKSRTATERARDLRTFETALDAAGPDTGVARLSHVDLVTGSSKRPTWWS